MNKQFFIFTDGSASATQVCRLGGYRDPRDKAEGDRWIGPVVNRF